MVNINIDDNEKSAIEKLFGELETFDLILARVLRNWGGRGVVVPRDKPQYLFDEPETFAKYCHVVRSYAKGRSLCWECDLKAANQASQEKRPIHYICDNGLVDVAIPIVVKGESIATILFGQRRILDDPQFNRDANIKLRNTEKLLQLKPYALQKDWEEVEGVTKVEMEQTISEVLRIAEFVAKISTERENLQDKDNILKLLDQELDQLSLSNLSLNNPLEDYWDKFQRIFPNLCLISGAKAGLVLRKDEGDGISYLLQCQYPDTQDDNNKFEIPENIWDNLLEKDVNILSYNQFSKIWEADSLFKELKVDNISNRDTTSIAIEIDAIQGERLIIILISNSDCELNNRSSHTLKFKEEIDVFQKLANNLKYSYSAVLRFYERLIFEEERRQYIQDITHQLVGPLSGLRAHCENLLRGRVTVERGKNVLETLVEQSGLIQRYAENFAFAARPGENIFDQAELRPEIFNERNLVDVLIKSVKSFQGQAKEKGIKGPSVVELSFRGFPLLSLDPELFEILMMNLVDNAIKYSYEDSPVIIEGKAHHDTVDIKITNHGIPIVKENVEKIFERHVRTPEAYKLVPIGTGIGLFICRQIVQLHKGTILVIPSRRSIFGNEVTFIITLPIAKSRAITATYLGKGRGGL